MSATKWIRCSEQMPPDYKDVWVTIKGHDCIFCRPGETIEAAIKRVSKMRWVSEGVWDAEEHCWNDPYTGGPLVVMPIAWAYKEDKPEPYKGRE